MVSPTSCHRGKRVIEVEGKRVRPVWWAQHHDPKIDYGIKYY